MTSLTAGTSSTSSSSSSSSSATFAFAAKPAAASPLLHAAVLAEIGGAAGGSRSKLKLPGMAHLRQLPAKPCTECLSRRNDLANELEHIIADKDTMHATYSLFTKWSRWSHVHANPDVPTCACMRPFSELNQKLKCAKYTLERERIRTTNLAARNAILQDKNTEQAARIERLEDLLKIHEENKLKANMEQDKKSATPSNKTPAKSNKSKSRRVVAFADEDMDGPAGGSSRTSSTSSSSFSSSSSSSSSAANTSSSDEEDAHHDDSDNHTHYALDAERNAKRRCQRDVELPDFARSLLEACTSTDDDDDRSTDDSNDDGTDGTDSAGGADTDDGAADDDFYTFQQLYPPVASQAVAGTINGTMSCGDLSELWSCNESYGHDVF